MMNAEQIAECEAALMAEGFVRDPESKHHWNRLKSPAHAKEHMFIGPGGWDHSTARSYIVGRVPRKLKEFLAAQKPWEPAPFRPVPTSQPLGALI